MANQTPQSYFVPDLKMNIKVTFISVNRYVADFPDGSERVKESDMKGWVHQGPWKDENCITITETA